jgi:signal transduction histidine kinase
MFGHHTFLAIPSPTALLAPSGVVADVNDAWCRLTGEGASDVGEAVWRRFAPAERARIAALVERFGQTASTTPVVAGTQIRHTDGRHIDVVLRLAMAHDHGPPHLVAQVDPLSGERHDDVRKPGTGDRQLALASIARSISTGISLGSISNTVISAVARATGCPLVGLWRRAAKHEPFVLEDGLGFGAGTRGVLALEEDLGGLAAHTIRSRSVVVIGGPTGTAAQLPRVLTERGVSSGLAAPVHGIAGGDGLLTVSATHNQPMDHEDIRFLAIVGDMLTMALQRESFDELITAEQGRTSAVSKDLAQLERRHRLTGHIGGLREWCWPDPRPVAVDRRVDPPPRWSVQACLDGGPQAIVDCAIADDLDGIAETINSALAASDDLDARVRLRTTEGVVPLRLRGMIDRDEFGNVRQVSGLAAVADQVPAPSPAPAPAPSSVPAPDHLDHAVHDLNNLLAAVLGTAEQLVDRGPDRRQLTAIVHAGRRARELVAGLRGRQEAEQHPLAGPYELADVVEQVRPLLHGLVGHDVRLIFQLASGARTIRPSRETLERILLDLVSNSADALSDSGTVVVTTDTCVQRDQATGPNAPPAGRWARLRVCDNGVGMTAAACGQIFAPGFTTKSGLHHCGLGLAAVRDAVTAAGGAITIDSAPDRGTVVDLYLPLAEQQPVRLSTMRPAVVAESARDVAPTALIADDESALRDLLDTLLSRLGFEVTIASDGADALAKSGGIDRLDLVVCDLRMPHLDGLELSRRIRDTHPAAAILMITGAPPTTPVADRNLRILRKPFEWRDLRNAVMDLIPDAVDPDTLSPPFPAASG